MTTKQQQTTTSAVTTTNARQAAQILYRMANSAGVGVGGGGIGNSSATNTITTEPITPVLLTTGPTMLQPSPAHFSIATSGFNALQPGGSGLQQAHNFIPVYFQQSSSGQQGQLKPEAGGMTFQFQPQYQVLQQQPQQQQGRAMYLTTAPAVDQQQYQAGRIMSNSQQQQQQQQNIGKSRAGGRKSATKDDKLSGEELDRRKVRRERNKQAAARCRKRRMDQTNVLTEETEGLEEVQNQLKADIDRYQQEINDIQSILEAHRSACPKDIPVTILQSPLPIPRARSVAPAVASSSASDTSIMPPPPMISVPSSMPLESVAAVESVGAGKKKVGTGSGVTRPASLPVKTDLQQLDLLAMPTPSPSKLSLFNFDTHSGLTPTGLTPTGLTPLIPSCSSDKSDNMDQSGNPSSTEATSPNNLVSL